MTRRQRQCLDAIEKLSKDGHAPTLSEIAVEMGIKPTSRGTVSSIISRLVARGHLKRDRYSRGAFEVVSKRHGEYADWLTIDLKKAHNAITAELVRRAVS